MNTDNSKAASSSGKDAGQGNASLVAALSYVEHGWPVFPIHSVLQGLCSCGRTQCDSAGKHPRTNHGLGDATFDVSIIQNWWQRWPDANIGLVTGSDSGLVVLDVDPRHGGDDSLARFQEEHGALPKTVESLTGGGGRHILFQHPGGYIKSRTIGQGLDIKADGGYIVAPPSVHRSGERYVWEISSQPEDIPLGPMPDWLLQLVTTGPKTNSTHANTTSPIPEGARNNTLTSLGGAMRKRGMTQSSIEAALLAENNLRCDPPLGEDEVRKIAASVSQYRPSILTTTSATADSTTVSTSTIGLDCPPNIEAVRQTVEIHFPHLWPAVDLGLATCATLLLADNANPAAIIFVGPASTGKTTVATMFSGSMCYRSDKFTPAAFVSHSAKATKAQLDVIDLLPRIQYKVLNTPELSTMFRGKPDELLERFSMITRVLDGQGLISDSGTHGRRGYEGDYLFAWLGCTTPFDPSVWRVMAQLGSRLFFYLLELADIKLGGYGNFRQSLNECREVVSLFLDQLFTQHGIRGVSWDSSKGTGSHLEEIAALAKLLAVLRTLPSYDGAPATPEAPMRAQAVLYNLARGHAVVHGRTYLADDDLPCITQVTLASMPRERRQALLAFAGANSQTLTVAEVQSAVGARSDDKARTIMADLDWLGIAQHQKAGMGKPSILQLQYPWHWITEPTFHSLLTAANLLPKGG